MKNKFTYFCLMLLCSCSNNQKFIGEEYLGAKYINSPLGEEKAPDTDPLIRFDAFDCVTFVETSIANGDINKLNNIRYKDGNIDFVNRNHFISTDWLNNNKDIVENVSDVYGKTKTRTVIIDKQKWLKKRHNITSNIKPQKADIKYIPYEDLHEINANEPLIVLFIYRNPKIYDIIGTDLAVIHMGFLLPNGKLRHASKKQGYVVDTDFNDYIKNIKQNKHNIGIALVKIK